LEGVGAKQVQSKTAKIINRNQSEGENVKWVSGVLLDREGVIYRWSAHGCVRSNVAGGAQIYK